MFITSHRVLIKSSESLENKVFIAKSTPYFFIWFYSISLTNGKLNSYLSDIDEQATDMMFQLVEQMADKDGVTEQLKAEDPILWIERMNEIQAKAREIVHSELIYN